VTEAALDNAPNPSAIPADELARMTDDIVGPQTVYDPEIPVDIYE
jgi:metal-sulfur cluster biosynthetic enzyme